jgi:DNA polymerase III epsilon subunit-like protein
MIAVIFDTETTGLIINPARKLDAQPEIVSIAIQKVDLDEAKMEDLYYRLYKPTRPIPPEITKIHGITNDIVKDADSIGIKLELIVPKLCDSELLIGQNVRFDMDMVELECRRYNYPIPKWPRTLDLVDNSIFLKGYRLSLTNLHIELFGKEFEGAHRADTDVQITARCAIEMRKRGWL